MIPTAPNSGTVRKKGGLVVTRRLWLDIETADYARETLSFPGLRILLRVDSETRGGAADPKTETRYFATGVDPERVTPDELLAAVRGHGQVENGLHFIKDRWWDEDRHYSTRPGVASRRSTVQWSAYRPVSLRRSAWSASSGVLRR